MKLITQPYLSKALLIGFISMIVAEAPVTILQKRTYSVAHELWGRTCNAQILDTYISLCNVFTFFFLSNRCLVSNSFF